MKLIKAKRFLSGAAVGAALLALVFLAGAVSDRFFSYRLLNRFFPRNSQISLNQKILNEESVVIDVAEKASPSVVTIGVTKTQRVLDLFGANPFAGPFGFFDQQPSGQEETVKQDVGSGFIVDESGLIVTNKHVVADSQAQYRVITKNDQEYSAEKIYRDPVDDLAILKINANKGKLVPIELGSSDNLKVGQFVMAIGTALGEFRHTVTTGVISGLGRGITAGSAYESYAEQLDNVIQTDAAINPGNSGGPLLNSAGQVIGINVAVATAGQNIGFALPINLVKDSLQNFQQTGQFERAFLGIRYRMIDRDLALMNEVPQGAYIIEVVAGAAADNAGIKQGDIVTDFDGQSVREENPLAKMINKKKAGDQVMVKIWRDGETMEKTVTLKSS